MEKLQLVWRDLTLSVSGLYLKGLVYLDVSIEDNDYVIGKFSDLLGTFDCSQSHLMFPLVSATARRIRDEPASRRLLRDLALQDIRFHRWKHIRQRGIVTTLKKIVPFQQWSLTRVNLMSLLQLSNVLQIDLKLIKVWSLAFVSPFSTTELAYCPSPPRFLQNAVSMYCRLGFARKKVIEDVLQFHPSWSSVTKPVKKLVHGRFFLFGFRRRIFRVCFCD